MKPIGTGIACVLVSLALAACSSDRGAQGDYFTKSATNKWLIEHQLQQQIDQAVIAEHTLYPHHFEQGTSQLNELGLRDLALLADHLRAGAGRLNIRQSAAGQELYDARLQTVRDVLIASGVDESRLELADAQAGGPGLPSEHVVVVLGAETERPAYPYQTYDEGDYVTTTTTTEGGAQ